ncbi:MAG TPA: hypothetical protein VHX65_07960 [Pirellulales bacterium]|jgi:Ca2+-binding EF-hand superfamily protein|nr:hypothetical protein [Pirellulales bacterium]
MPKIAGILGVVALLLSFAAVGNADPPPKNDKKADEAKNRASQLAEDVFNKADKHKHGFLNKYEFKKADADMYSAVKQMAVDGLIGKGRPQRTKNNSDTSSNTPSFTGGFADADTDHDKKVTLPEFTDYVSRAIATADENLREQAAARAAAAAAVHVGGGYGGRR